MRYKLTMRALAKAGLSLLTLSSSLLLCSGSARGERPLAPGILSQQAASASLPSNGTQPVLLTPAQLETLLPATVYFRGRSAPVQLRNAAGVRFGPEGYFLAAMVDTAGYASSVQESYQLYLITESAVTIAGQRLAPGAYGAGVVGGRLVVMDVGGHPVLQADATVDRDMPRPRPLQLVTGPAGEIKLYLNRNWVTLAAASTP